MQTAKEWTYTVIAKGKFGGFEAYLVNHGAVLLVSALVWRGNQPRMVLERYPQHGGAEGEWGYHDPGFSDWLPLLSPCHEVHSFEGDDVHAQNLEDQWLAQRRDGNGDGPYSRRARMLPY